MALTPGSSLGPYQIDLLVGTGGMGQVYKAHDPRLGRDVAIKIAGEAFSERFTREARSIAALNHTNICHLYDVGPDYLVMEFVEGQTLQGPVPFEDALPIIRQLIDGIEAAHERNIVHRDLKPANIKVTPEGVVKILDFGLAKAVASESTAIDVTNSPTLAFSVGVTQQGTILGTSAYMAPEQAKGKPADARADIWAFGVIVYELLTGTRLFQGETAIEILGEVLNKTPDLSRVPPQTKRLLAWCLEKDRKQRLQAIGDARRVLNEESAVVAATAPPPSSHWSGMGWAAAVVAVVGFAAAAGAAAWFAYPRLNPEPVQVTRFQIEPPENTSLTVGLDSVNGGAVSPDGTRLVFAARDASGKVLLWLRSLDAFASRPQSGTDGAAFPFWSPDSRFIGFFASGKLMRIDAAGGPAQTICDVPGTPRGGTWGSRGVVLFGTAGTPIFQVPAEGGQPQPATRLDDARKESAHRWPSFLPDGRTFLYQALAGGNTIAHGIYLGSIDGNGPAHLLDSETNAIYAPPGFVLFTRDGTLVRQSFDATTRVLGGAPVPVAEQIALNAQMELGAFSASTTGILTFRSGSTAATQFTWFDRTGRMLETIGPPGVYRGPALSPDGTRLAFGRTDQQAAGDIWLLDLVRATMSRFTFNPGSEAFPIWSPDGSTIIYTADKDGAVAYYQKSASGTGAEELLAKAAPSATTGSAVPAGVSPDGKVLLYFENSGPTGQDIFALPLAGDRKPLPVVRTPFTDAETALSPDGRWIAYGSNETGRYEVYVQPFPSAGGRWQISSAGGRQPAWRGDGKELFFASDDKKLYAVDVKGSGKTFEYGAPHVLFEMRTDVANVRNSYVVSRDGQRVLVNALLDAGASPINVVVNWPTEIKK